METIISASKAQVSSELGNEVAILQTESGVYYGLDAVGKRVWQLIQQPLTLGAITSAITAEYDVDPVRCAQDIVELLGNLRKAGLIEVRDETVV